MSEEERRRLEELETDLAANDPELAQTLQSGSVQHRFRASTYFGVIASLFGLALLIAGINSQVTVVGVAGFLLMGTGAYLLLNGHFTHGLGNRQHG